MSPRTTAFTLASLLALALAADLLWMPVQVSDSLDEILDARASPSAWATFDESLRSDQSHLRPLRAAQTKILFDAARGEHYWLAYRGFHAALLIAGFLLFTAAQRVSTWSDAAASAFALVVLIGSRMFRGNVQEAFPVNHFLEVLVCCLIVLNLARSRPRPRNAVKAFRQTWLIDVAAVFTLCAAALTLESGLLVFVVAVGAWIVGWRGISLRGLAAMTLVVAGYAYLQAVYQSVSGLPDRSTGFLFAMLEPAELQQRFGDRPGVLYAYNVAASALSVLFSEPSSGVFLAARAWVSGDLLPRLVIPVVTSTATTLLIVWAAARCVRQRPWHFDDTARFIVLFGFVLAANAVLSYSYTKDEIMGVAGAFYALAAFAAIRSILQFVDGPLPAFATGVGGQARGPAFVVPLIATLAILTAGWSVRAAGTHYLLRTQAFRHQNDWVETPGTWKRDGRWPDDPAAQRLMQQLHDAAVGLDVPNPRVGEPGWVGRLWED